MAVRRWLPLICVLLPLVACRGRTGSPPQRLTDALRNLMASRVFDRMLPDGWRTDSLTATDRAVELKFIDGAGSEHAVELTPRPPEKGESDGRGEHFFYRFLHGADSPRDVQVLLWAAGVVDTAVGNDSVALAQPPRAAGPPPPRAVPEGQAETAPRATSGGAASSGTAPEVLVPPPPPQGMAPFNPGAPSGDGAPIMGPDIPITRTIALYFHSIDQRATTSRLIALALGLVQSLLVCAAILLAMFPSMLGRAAVKKPDPAPSAGAPETSTSIET
jgi:hypothetical protein